MQQLVPDPTMCANAATVSAAQNDLQIYPVCGNEYHKRVIAFWQ